MTSIPAVGIVGIGAMGLPMARNLQRRGVPALVRDIDPKAVAAARACGLEACDSAAALAARCDTVIVVVVDAAQIDDVLFGADGVARAAPSPRTVVLCSTIAPADTERFGHALAAHGIDLVDAPISGGPARAGDGTLSMMAAAAPGVLARCEPLLRMLAASLHVVGERPGDGARVKLVNNMLAGIHLAAGAEALALGMKLGLDAGLLMSVIDASSGASWIFADRMKRLLAGDFEPRARTRILAKDMSLAVALAGEAGVAAPLARAALDAFAATVAAGFGDADDASVVAALRQR